MQEPQYAKILNVCRHSSEVIWRRRLDRPITLDIRYNQPADRKRWPAFWDADDASFILGICDDYDLAASWWASSAQLSHEQRAMLAISHEITHLFMFPAPLTPWFQELVAMKIGENIAVAHFPELAEVFVGKEAELTAKSFNLSYRDLATDFELCRELQWQAYTAAQPFSKQQLVDWVEALRLSPPENPQNSMDEVAANHSKIMAACPASTSLKCPPSSLNS